MKYSRSVYESSWYFSPAYKFSTDKKKLTSVRYPHKCGACSSDIPAGTQAMYFEKVWKVSKTSSGWARCWICTDCCDRWIDGTHQIKGGQLNGA